MINTVKWYIARLLDVMRSPLSWLNRGAAHSSGSRILSYQALADATNGFDSLVGRGGFGPVYCGQLDGRAVAVKVLEAGGGQGVQEFQREVKTLSRCRHENIVPLLAYAMTPGQPLCLVYAFMAGGALSDALRNPGSLREDQRLRVAEEVARGLAYLHEQDVVHRDIKSANILLDGEGRARVADAGLARDVNAQTTTMTRGLVVGSPGYLDPEYARTYQVTTASDVYSYGVVLLELLTGLPALDSNQQPPPLAERLRLCLPRSPEVDEVFREVPALLLGTLARRCIALGSAERPTAAAVLQEFAPMRAAGLMQPPCAPRERTCVVCLDAPINTRWLQCRHSAVCEACAAGTLRRGGGCPICRAPVERFEVGEFPTTFEAPRRSFAVFYKLLDGRAGVLADLSPSTSIYDVKQLIQDNVGYPIEPQCLIVAGRELEVGRTLSDYNIQHQSTIVVTLDLRGDIGVFGDHAGKPGTCLLEAGRATPAESRAVVEALGGTSDAFRVHAGLLKDAECAVLRAHADARHQGEADLKLDVSLGELDALVGTAAAGRLVAFCGEPFDAIILRRCEPRDHLINFHLDYHTRTVQIALVDDEAYEGGRLAYATRDGLRLPPRPAGTATVHTNAVVHGVSRHTAGVRYGLFFLQRPATPRSVTQV